MRKIVLPVVILAVIGLGGWAVSLNQKLGQTKADYTSLQAQEQATSARYAAAIDEVANIQESLKGIDLGEQSAQALETQLAQEQNLSKDQGEQTMARINEIKAGVERAKNRIADLEDKLKKSNTHVAGLEKLIKGLRATVVEREAQIAQLTTRVAELQTEVTGLKTEVATGQETIRVKEETIQQQTASLEDKRRHIGTIYYTVGTKKDLARAGLIESKGGVLGLGKTVRPTGATAGGAFTALDTDQETVITIDAKKARVVTAQPAASYSMESDGTATTTLRITDREAFRAIKYVIILKED